MAAGHADRFNGMFDGNADHRIGLVVNEFVGDFPICAADAKNEIADLDLTDRLWTVSRVDQRVRRKTLVDRDRRVVGDLEEWHDPLAEAVGAFDVAAKRP